MNQQHTSTETLSYWRVARKQKDGENGFLYIHKWATGHQQLIFPTHEAAERFRETLSDPVKLSTYLKHPA